MDSVPIPPLKNAQNASYEGPAQSTLINMIRGALKNHPGGTSDSLAVCSIANACVLLTMAHPETAARVRRIERLTDDFYGKTLAAGGANDIRRSILSELESMEREIGQGS